MNLPIVVSHFLDNSTDPPTPVAARELINGGIAVAGDGMTITVNGSLITFAVDGAVGPVGPAGADGADGSGWTGGSYDPATGIVTFASADGLGFATGDLRGVQGVQGIPGTNGVSIQSVTINGSNHLIVTLTDSSTLDAGEIPAASAAWGSIGGTLSSQTDLQNALNAKVSASGLNTSIDARVNGGSYTPEGTWNFEDATVSGFAISFVDGLQTALDGKAAASHTHNGTEVSIDASGFDGNLANTDNTVQKVAQKLDDLTVSGGAGLDNAEDISDGVKVTDDAGTSLGTLQTGVVSCVSPAIDAVPISVEAAAGQTGNLIEANSNGGTGGDRFRVASSGSTVVGGNLTVEGIYTTLPNQGQLRSLGIATLIGTWYFGGSTTCRFESSGSWQGFVVRGDSSGTNKYGYGFTASNNSYSGFSIGLIRNSSGRVQVSASNGSPRDFEARNIVATSKVSAATLNLSGLPTSDPLVAGDVWNDSGTLKISAG